MNKNERIYVKFYMATTVEDTIDRGETGECRIAWTSNDNPIKGSFATIADALQAVCEANCFDYRESEWRNFAKAFGDEAGRFDFQVLVDADNCEASASEIEEWKRGAKRLWNCSVSVYLGVRAERELTLEECEEAA